MDVCLAHCVLIKQITADTDPKDEDSIIAGLQAFDAWHEDLGNPSPAQIGALNACPSISGLVVGPIIAYIDEHYGRRWGIRCESTFPSFVVTLY